MNLNVGVRRLVKELVAGSSLAVCFVSSCSAVDLCAHLHCTLYPHGDDVTSQQPRIPLRPRPSSSLRREFFEPAAVRGGTEVDGKSEIMAIDPRLLRGAKNLLEAVRLKFAAGSQAVSVSQKLRMEKELKAKEPNMKPAAGKMCF